MRDVLKDVLTWSDRGERAVLALLIDVDRSAPLDPGAALAVSSSGAVSGSISGGCVEPALCEEAAALFSSGGSTRVAYGIADDDAFGVGLTCGGTIEVFLTFLDAASIAILRALADALDTGERCVLGAVVGEEGAGRLALVYGEERHSTIEDIGLREAVLRDAQAMVETGTTGLRRYGAHGGRRPDDVEVFVRAFATPPDMLIFGAIDFAAALARVGRFMGYRVTVCDARPVFATPERLPDADRVIARWPHEFLAETPVDASTVICVLTHDPKFDVPLLQTALGTPAGYIGAMGSRRTHEDRVRRLLDLGFDAGVVARISGPIGLDLGARSPEEVAVAIAAEIIALRNGASAQRLTERPGPIHLSRREAPA
jgi:xanthine dehydrogenase accessory factor